TLLDAQMPREAREILEALARRRPESFQALHSLSVACFQLGDREAGVANAHRALEHNGRFVPALHNLAVAAVQARRWDEARAWVRKALEVDSDDASLRRLRVKIALRSRFERLRTALRRR